MQYKKIKPYLDGSLMVMASVVLLSIINRVAYKTLLRVIDRNDAVSDMHRILWTTGVHSYSKAWDIKT